VSLLLAAAAAGGTGLAVALALGPRPMLSRRVEPSTEGRSRAPEAGSRRVVVAVGLGTALVVALLAPGWLAVAALPLGVVAGRHAGRLETRAARRRRERLERELPHLVDLVSALVVSGSAPDVALRASAGVVSPEVAAELRPWVGRLLLGSDPVGVWVDIASHPQLGRLGTTLHRAAVTGAPVAEALQRLSHDLRTARGAEVRRRVRQVEVRAAAPLGACLLPAFVLVGVVPLVAGVAQGLVLGG
jgi:Flp pilus assembly protein TadB